MISFLLMIYGAAFIGLGYRLTNVWLLCTGFAISYAVSYHRGYQAALEDVRGNEDELT